MQFSLSLKILSSKTFRFSWQRSDAYGRFKNCHERIQITKGLKENARPRVVVHSGEKQGFGLLIFLLMSLLTNSLKGTKYLYVQGI